METTDCPTEGEPLKSGEDGGETGPAPPATELKRGCKEVLGLSKLTHWRTAVFFLSLFLCLTVVFAFSFIIPCPVRPQYIASWNRTFSGAKTYDFLAIEDASKDKVMDVLLVVKDTEASVNNTCGNAGLPSPCVFMLAVDGTDGETLWERPLDPDFHWAQCGLDTSTGQKWDCLLFHSDQLSALDKSNGEVRWQRPQPPGLHSSVPVLSVPDLDGDKVSDVALVASDSVQTQLVFLSGGTGIQIGSTVALNATQTAGHLLHTTGEGAQYLLLQKDTGLYGLALWRIAAEAKEGLQAGLKKPKQMERKAAATSGLVPVYESDSLRRVVRTDKDQTSNLMLVTGSEVVLIDGKTFQPLWTFNTTTVFREPAFGHFNKDGVLDVVLEEDMDNSTKRVLIVDGKSGAVLWNVDLLSSANTPRPTSVHTANSISIFVFWGLLPQQRNSSVPSAGERRSYMLHPLYSNVLLQSENVMDHIITFKATLMERGRHAAFILLTGPGTEDTEGTVVLSKWKLKHDVPQSTVRPIGDGKSSDTENDIKEAFNRLRFSDN
ncbi:protein FAM234A [Phyllopteryx taeniolatus]|uniref:protein FAM234A n=1 Tax=Phyllopteryx taeniolatus TaxID=161469 RepID=UPI002AD1EF84|nr:protein FAM234A [Phyllopteryx taeniolatus]XP_061613291.1 protein FAM234A [Phyllopteryx taeniolatus]XP_061613292.1 protein FAM234A [Phyllopteryx taeniolatus]XP_061613293.1 protein FAM234A [Phyllopteryx taeniolatus]XP_061613294.1 protein FAM234A [Phyllopteryx taeniolatus]XP_061613295.1 protein FAM234A [Phyllopteryx taeniolatus]